MGHHRFNLARQYYTILSLVLLTLAGLSAASMEFARSTLVQARLIEGEGALLTKLTGPVRLLAEQHRGLIERAAREPDAARLKGLRGDLSDLQDRLARAAGAASVEAPADMAELAALRSALPALFHDGRLVLDFADAEARFAPGAGGVLGALAEYGRAADALGARLAAWHDALQGVQDDRLRSLHGRAGALVGWAQFCVSATLAGALLSFAVTRRALTRLHRLTEAMLDLTAGRLDVAVPEGGDTDELDDLCRAAAAFQESARQTRRHRDALQRANALFDGALSNMRHGLIMFDAAGRIDVINRKAYELYRIDPAAVGPGSTLAELVAHGVARGNFAGRTAGEVLAEMSVIAADDRAASSWATGDGRTVVVAHEHLPDGAWITTHEDVTDRRRSEEQVRFLERHDALTGLANRLELSERLAAAFAERAAGRRQGGFALHCLDVRRLKAVNDMLGHPVGDALLAQVADRMRAEARDGEFVARMEGDRFAILQGTAERAEDAAALARRFRRAIEEPCRIGGHDIVAGVSIGVALAPSDGDGAETLLRSANRALARAKADPPGGWRFFEPDMDAQAQGRRMLESGLRAALQRGEFEVWYQPLLNTGTRRVSGFEALVRWRHPERGVVSPAEFIPLAEETGMIVPLGAWVLRTACAEAAGWPSGLKLAVNLSSAQFRDPDLVRTVVEALDEADFPADRLDLEITESVLLQESEATLATLHEMRALGVRISMDDFGTGYSSLSYLRSFPFDKIKIDRSFVTDLSDRADSLAIVRAVTSLGRSLGMTTTAEGVETDAQLARLSSEGCTEVQGFLFSPPRPAGDLPALMRRLSSAAGELAA